MNKDIFCSVVIPVYNARLTLEDLQSRLTKVLTSLGKPYEIILVDDCSKDNSWGEMKILREVDNKPIAQTEHTIIINELPIVTTL